MARLPPGPARFFAEHPVLHGLSLAAAAGAAAALELRSARARRPAAKLGWGLLSVLEWGIVIGLLTLPREPDGPGAARHG